MKLARELKRRPPAGFDVVPRRGGHLHVVDEAGEPVRLPNGMPLRIAGTPRSPEQVLEQALQACRRAGVRVE